MTPRPDLNNLAKEVCEVNVAKGFHDREWSNEHLFCLVISKLMKAVEADRKEKRADVQMFFERHNMYKDNANYIESNGFAKFFEKYIKDSVEDELADAVLGLLDIAGLRGYDIDTMKDQLGLFYCEPLCEEFESFTEHIFSITGLIHEKSDIDFKENEIVELVIIAIETLCRELSIDLWLHVDLKLKYNQTRPNKHGKEY